jgi:SAM-dependent methyltransferase
MKNLTARLIDAAAESFPMRGPVYEFGFSPGWSAGERGGAGASGSPARIDRLEDLDRLPFEDAVAGSVVCENALQYVFEPRRTVAEMVRILAPGGLLVLAESTRSPAAAGAPERYWTIHPSAIGRLFSELSGTLIGWIGPDAAPHTVFGVGCRWPITPGFAGGVQPFLERLERLLAERARPRGVLRFVKERWSGSAFSPRQRQARRDEHRVQYALHLPVDEQSRPAILDSCLPQAKTGTRLDLSE